MFVGVQSVCVCGCVESVFVRVCGVSVCVVSVHVCAWSQCVVLGVELGCVSIRSQSASVCNW